MARRKTEVFSMSFLDVIACGFGAIVLFYTIIAAQAGVQRQDNNDEIQSEVNKLEEEVLEGFKNLVVLRNSLEKTDRDTPTEGLAAKIVEETERLREQLAESEESSLSKRESIEKLKQDLKSIEESNRRLSAGTESEGKPGTRVKGFIGTGDRQYLQGMRVAGKHILILADASASMLDETLVNVIRLRNMPETRRLTAPKWRRAVATVDWVTSQIPAGSQWQLYGFNVKPFPLVEGSAGKWLSGNDSNSLNEAVRKLRTTVPKDGTSLENAFALITQLSPRPDAVFIITDGLPTQGAEPPAIRRTIDGDGRLKLLERALGKVPNGIPISVILMPMEGDPMAASAFWTIARRTSGSFLSPAKDWP